MEYGSETSIINYNGLGAQVVDGEHNDYIYFHKKLWI